MLLIGGRTRFDHFAPCFSESNESQSFLQQRRQGTTFRRRLALRAGKQVFGKANGGAVGHVSKHMSLTYLCQQVELHRSGRGTSSALGRSSRLLGHSLRFVPKLAGDIDRIDAHIVPPGSFIAVVVEFAMVGSAKRHGEVIADLASHGARLREADVMSVRGCMKRRPSPGFAAHREARRTEGRLATARCGESRLLSPHWLRRKLLRLR